MDFVFEQIRVGGDRNFGYLLGDRAAGVAVAVDPSYSPQVFADRAGAQGLTISHVVNTHGHADHTNGNAALCERTGALVAAHPDATPAPDVPLGDGETWRVGALEIAVHHVPGHAPDHILLHLARQAVAITGDLLFVGKIGGTGNDTDARTEYASLERVLAALPDETTIWPGHDYGCRPASTIALERAVNPFLRVKDVAEFLELKRDWARFKAEHGLV